MQAPSSDRPLSDPEDDKYGFVELASRLAVPIAQATAGDGLVVGIEGPWGTGKTTLLEFLSSSVRDAGISELRTITLAPWLQGDRVDLATELLAKLGEALDAESKGSRKKAAREELKETIGRYAILAGRGGAAVLDVAGDFVPGSSSAKKGITFATETLEGMMGGRSLPELKAELRERISKSGLRFVVVIDDLDRLEPAQAAEVIRIVRSVADFPRVVYVLSYDRDVLAHALEQSLGVKDGVRYLQKVVQLSLPMPAFEPFDLRLQLREQLSALYSEFDGTPLDEEAVKDLERAVDSAGSFLTSPREVTLVVNAVRFAWHASRLDTYYPDVCRVQTYKIVRRDLYDWLEEYLGVRSVLVTGAGQLNKVERQRFGTKLHEVLPDDDASSNSIYTLAGIVPGLSRNEEPDKRVFGDSYGDEISALIERKRLGSPIHSRAYFAFAIPKTVLSDAAWKHLLETAGSDPAEFERLILHYAKTQRPIGGNWLFHVLDRLDTATVQALETEQATGMVTAFANVMDDVMSLDLPWALFQTSVDRRTAWVVQNTIALLREKAPELLAEILDNAFENGRALSWLVGELVRSELFARGEAGDGRSSGEPVLTDDELDRARSALGPRIELVASDGSILDLPRASRFLWGWRDLIGEQTVRDWITSAVDDDHTFIQLMLRLRGAVFSDREYRVLKSENVEPFMDWDNARQRTEELANLTDVEVGNLAREVRDAIKLAASY